MLSAFEITVSSGQSERLSKVDLDLNPAELVAVVGPNGAGKSTLLQALAGKLPLSHGIVKLENKSLDQWDRKMLAKRRAVLSQHISVAFEFNVRDVVMLGRSPHIKGKESEIDRAIVRKCIARMKLDSMADRVCNRLSGGEQQRVHIARTMAQIGALDSKSKYEGHFLLLDEPTSSLDIQHQHLAMGAFQDLSRLGVGVLAVLHDINLAASYADKVVILDNGLVAAYGTPEEVMTPELLGEVFKAKFLVQTHPQLSRPTLFTVPTRQQISKPVRRIHAESMTGQ